MIKDQCTKQDQNTSYKVIESKYKIFIKVFFNTSSVPD